MLVSLLEDATFDRILSSPYVRCMETVVPIAGDRGMAVEPVAELTEAAPVDGAIALVRKHAIPGALLCMHGDVLPMMLDHYAAAGVDIPEEREWPKGCIWTLETDSTGEVVRARYTPPPNA
jgi:8-oxo-dGTP diphosphatase